MLVVAFHLGDLQQCGGYMFGSRRIGGDWLKLKPFWLKATLLKWLSVELVLSQLS